MSDYTKHTLAYEDLDPNPFLQFAKWWQEAKEKEEEPEAMALATANLKGVPSSRMVLLKGHDERGFIFFTNSHSRKGQDLKENPIASITFYWGELERQVIASGNVVKIPPSESNAYFESRARASQLGAWASNQDAVLTSREELMNRYNDIEKKYEGQKVPRPPYWEGYRLQPDRIEFWQGRESRLHDRFVYLLKGSAWTIQRLSP
jgi:pyridoxamine 5'-phosphate oxidase